ncbi:hypothetical protein WN51_09860 [Melipona quadrifasciata]|uniref:Uncharacterized protein n=1 Tax=Melipona quadrifasciata TaxID=166423 RepID=A0A0M9A6M8_9HYME|nr:hypothetical protein WN51_09860 [Melipona quadrifasciata]
MIPRDERPPVSYSNTLEVIPFQRENRPLDSLSGSVLQRQPRHVPEERRPPTATERLPRALLSSASLPPAAIITIVRLSTQRSTIRDPLESSNKGKLMTMFRIFILNKNILFSTLNKLYERYWSNNFVKTE